MIRGEHQKLVVDSIVWGFKHTDRNISEMGLEILFDLLQHIARHPDVAPGFYQVRTTVGCRVGLGCAVGDGWGMGVWSPCWIDDNRVRRPL